MTSDSGRARVVFIAGGTSGIGLALARQLATAGNHLAILARGPEPLSRTAAECKAAGAASVMTLAADVADGAAVYRGRRLVCVENPGRGLRGADRGVRQTLSA